MNIDLQNRSPRVERLPDERLRVTRLYDVLNNIPSTPAGIAAAGLWLDWGMPDADYPNCRLIHQDIGGQEGEFLKPCDEPPKLVRVYEEIPENDEIVVGNPSISYDQYGNKTAALDYLQFSAGTSVYTYVVGTTLAPAPNDDCFLKTLEVTNDGTLIRTKRTFINRGELSDTEQIKFGGKLLLRELTYLNQIPPTPSGWSLITQSTEFISGLPVYRYGFANGSSSAGAGGVISTETVYNRSPDQGSTGVTVVTVKKISASSVTTNPINPSSGYQLISVQFEDQDGYRLWTAIYAHGQGVVSSTVETRQGGKLVIYSITSINSAPAAPAPTIGGTVVLVKADVSNGTRVEDGTVVYDYQWAEGYGVIDAETETKNNGALILYHTISLGVAPDAPSPTIGGTVNLISADVREADGYQIYDYRWAKGQGVISSDVETKNNGALILYHIVSYGTSPDAPSPTIGGTVALVDADVRQGDGYQIYDYRWAEGQGVISSTVETREGGLLVIYGITSLGVPPNTPASTIGGTVTRISSDVRQGDGYAIYDYKWAEGFGEIGRSTEYLQTVNPGADGITRVTIKSLTPIGGSDPTTTPGAGFVEISVSSQSQDGYLLWTAVWAVGSGIVIDSAESKEGGFLFIYRRSELNPRGDYTPATPDPRIGGTVTVVSQEKKTADGYFVYDSTWAEGNGEVGRSTEYIQSTDLGVTGITRVTIRALTALGASDPTVNPGGFVQMSVSNQAQDGYLLWTTTWVKGTGTVSTGTEIREGGKLVLYHIVAIGAAPATPTATIGGTVTLIDSDVITRDGYTIYDYRWAEGNGEVSRDTRFEQSVDGGTTGLTIIVIRFLSSIPTASNPISTPGGFIKISETYTGQDGYKLWTGSYAKGAGTVSTQTRTREDGSKITVVASLGPTATTPSGTGYLVGLDQDLSSGHYINRATYIVLPPTTTFRKVVKGWQMPGFAYFSGTQLVLQPPTTLDKLASIEVSYDTSQITTEPFSVTKWASFYFTYTTTETDTVPSQTVNGSQGLTGYLAEGGTTFGSNSDYNGVLCDSYSATKVASDPTALPSGDVVIDVDNDPYLITISGTMVFKRTVTTIAV